MDIQRGIGMQIHSASRDIGKRKEARHCWLLLLALASSAGCGLINDLLDPPPMTVCDLQQALPMPLVAVVNEFINIQVKDPATCDNNLQEDGCSPADVTQIDQAYACFGNLVGTASTDPLALVSAVITCIKDTSISCKYWK